MKFGQLRLDLHHQTTTVKLPPLTMRLGPMVCGLVAFPLSLVSATALTYKLTPNEKACFFSYVEEKGAKLAFYFAASSLDDPVLTSRSKSTVLLLMHIL